MKAKNEAHCSSTIQTFREILRRIHVTDAFDEMFCGVLQYSCDTYSMGWVRKFYWVDDFLLGHQS